MSNFTETNTDAYQLVSALPTGCQHYLISQGIPFSVYTMTKYEKEDIGIRGRDWAFVGQVKWVCDNVQIQTVAVYDESSTCTLWL